MTARHVFLIACLVLGASCGGDPSTPADAGIDAINDPTCPGLKAVFLMEVDPRQAALHFVCTKDRDCVVINVSCCLDSTGQTVVNTDGRNEVTATAAQYQAKCPVPCPCTLETGSPGCERGLALCGYN